MGGADKLYEYIPDKNISWYKEDDIDQYLFKDIKDENLYSRILPVLCLLGIIFNLLTICLYQHPRMRCLSTLLLRSLLLIDAVYMVTVILTFVPLSLIHHLYQAGRYEAFWESLKSLQSMALVSAPLTNICKLLSQWYTLALVAEQFAAIYYPETLAKYAGRDKGIKLVITILNLSILIHMISFFKYIQRKVNVMDTVITEDGKMETLVFQANEACISTIYRNSYFQAFEKYFYFAMLELCPTLLTLALLIATCVAYRKLKEQLNDIFPNPDFKLLQMFKSGRSVRTVISLAIVYLCIQLVNFGLFGSLLPYLDRERESCRLLALDKAYTTKAIDIHIRQAYIFVFVVNCCVKPVICLIANAELKMMIIHWCNWYRGNIRDLSSRIYVVIDINRPQPPQETSDRAETLSEQHELSRLPSASRSALTLNTMVE